MNGTIRKISIALLLAGLALPAAASDRSTEAERAEERAARRARTEESREARELERELRIAQRAFQAAARKVQEIQAQLVAEQAEARALELEALRSKLRSRNRARLGIVVDPAGNRPDEGPGARIMAITPGSPAEEAGLLADDVILSMNGADLTRPVLSGEDVNAATELIRRAAQLEPGDKVTLRYRRGGETHTVTLEARTAEWNHVWVTRGMAVSGHAMETWPYALLEPESPDAETVRKWLNLELVALNPDLGKYFGSSKGVLVVHTPDEPPLDVKPGDVIVRIGETDLTTPLEALRILRRIDPGQRIEMKVLRDRNLVTIKAVVPRIRRAFRWESVDPEKDD